MALGNLAQRALVAVVAVPVLFFILYYFASPVPTWALVYVATLLAMAEFWGMTMPGEAGRASRQASMLIGGLAVAMFFWLHPSMLGNGELQAKASAVGPLATVTFVLLGFGLYYLFAFGDMATVAVRFAYSMTGVFYGGLPFTFLAMCKRDFGSKGADVVILVLAIAWISDTGAYFAGRFLGQRKLYPAVSPKKTWAGAIGGLAGAVAATIVMKLLRLPELSWLMVALIAVPGGILGQLGDLAESLLKRSVGVKDSGALLPGHGGVLDRIDAVLFIAPYVYLALQFA